MKFLSLFLFGLIALSLPQVSLQAQELQARLVMQSDELWSVVMTPRRPGTTQIQVTRTDREALITVPLTDIKQIYFDLTAFQTDTLRQLFVVGRYSEVVEALKGRIIPYFAYVDMEANSNELVSLFIRSLYHMENYGGVRAAANEINKYTASGDMSRMANTYLALGLLKQNQGVIPAEAMEALEKHFRDPELDDPLASPIWYGQALLALRSNDWVHAHPPLAKIITEKPLDTEWVGDALYRTAEHHHSTTNLVVANQICLEIQMVVPVEAWKEKSLALQSEIREQAEALNIVLKDYGDERRVDDGTGADEDVAKIDYRKRQRELEEAERQARQAELENLNQNPNP